MSRRGIGLVAVAAAFLLLIGALLVHSAIAPSGTGSSGALFGAYVQQGPTTGLKE
jgi:hypothetical protein